MEKDDYFVVVYKILSYLYWCFKAGMRPDLELLYPGALRINYGYWANILESLFDEGYIKGILFTSGGILNVKITDLKITQKGIAYLQDDPKMEKAKKSIRRLEEITLRNLTRSI